MTNRRSPRRRARGFGLIDAVIALAILAFGLLGMSRLQARALAQATEGNQRATAAQFGDELISSALVDISNVACYQWPAAGTCGSSTALTATSDWNTRLVAALKNGSATSAYDATAGRLTVTVTWTGQQTGDTRTLVATTDVR